MHTPAFPPTRWKTEKWEINVENPASGLLLARARGVMDMPAAQHLMDAFDNVAASVPGKVDAFHDWEEMEGYDPDARQAYAAWSKAHPERLNSVNVLVKARAIHVAVALANVAVGGVMRAYSERALWDAALQKAIAGRTD